MSPDRLRECLAALRWSQRGLADALGCDHRLVQRWAVGAAAIPSAVSAWLEALARHADQHPPPPPQEWRSRRDAPPVTPPPPR